jgi:hypothetical protein
VNYPERGGNKGLGLSRTESSKELKQLQVLGNLKAGPFSRSLDKMSQTRLVVAVSICLGHIDQIG